VKTEEDRDWLDLLDTAKQIRRSVHPVAPSPGFRSHLRSDLACSLSTRRASPLYPDEQTVLTPGLVLGVCLGLAAIALSLIAVRSSSPPQR
jgi:hypothetical protein